MTPPRIVVTASPWALPRSIPGVFAGLLELGAEVVFAAGPDKAAIPAGLASHPRARAAVLPVGDDAPGAEELSLFRRTCDFARFLDPDLAEAVHPRRRTALRMLVRAGHPDAAELAAELEHVTLERGAHAALAQLLNGVERLVPPDPALVETIGALDADAVLLVSRCSLGGVERDVLKTARALGLPAVMLVWSWDNLSSKAILNEHPDHLLVWNELQVDEAERLHGFPRERVHVLGAPGFDAFFAELDDVRDEPRRSGARKTILYLGSSKNISKHEPELFLEWLARVRAADDERVRTARVVVRPYPGGGRWGRWDPEPSDDFELARGRKLEPDALARLLHEADAVVALNTSAELEAAIADVPVVTYRAGERAPGQAGSVHFEYLLEQNGGFVLDARNLEEHVAKLAGVLGGDYDRGRLRNFVGRFVRPAGIDRPVSPLVAAKVLELVPAPALA